MTDATEKMIADLNKLVCSPDLPDDKKCDCIRIAYGMGFSDGRVAGAQSMGETMTASVNRALDKLTATLVSA